MDNQQANNANLLGRLIGSTITTFANADANRDGTLQTGEIFGAALSVLLKGAQAFESLDDAINELKNEGSEARKQLIEGLALEFNITNDELELLVEDSLSFIEKGIDLTERWVAYSKKNEAVQG